jgi:hypothetical protein
MLGNGHGVYYPGIGKSSLVAENMQLEKVSTEEEILSSSRVVAVVGLSTKPDRPSYNVASYLMKNGYKIIPVNPKAGGDIRGGLLSRPWLYP